MSETSLPGTLRFYFAYGSNLDVDQMRERCPDCQPRFAAHLHDHRLTFSHYSQRWRGGAADIRREPGSIVYGVVYSMGARDFDRLDPFEGGYERVNHRVLAPPDALHEVTTYHVLRKAQLRPSRVYLDKMLHWGSHWGFPKHYLDALAAGGTCDEG